MPISLFLKEFRCFSAGKPAPTGMSVGAGLPAIELATPPVGAGLPAIELVYQ